MDVARQQRVAENESAFRDVNERIEESHQRLGMGDDLAEFLCECGEASCSQRVFLRLGEYEAVRSSALRFATVPGHEIPDAERVVEQNERFAVVEKIEEGARVATERDPRSP